MPDPDPYAEDFANGEQTEVEDGEAKGQENADIEEADETYGPDDSQEDDTGEDEGQKGQQDDAAVRQPRRKTASDTIRELRKQRQQAERERDDLRREREELLRRQSGPSPAELERQRAEEAARLEMMDPYQRVEYLRQKDRLEFDQKLNSIAFQQADTGDRTRFEALCDRKPHFAAISDEVERVMSQERSMGRNPSREVVAHYLLGKKADEQASRARGRQAKAAAAERGRQTVRAQTSRGDVPAAGRSGNDSRAARNKRLEQERL